MGHDFAKVLKHTSYVSPNVILNVKFICNVFRNNAPQYELFAIVI